MRSANLAEIWAERARERGWLDRPAFHTGDQAHTHGAVHEAAARTATVLAGAGAAPGERVLIALRDRIELVWALLATWRLGAVAVMVNPQLAADEHAYLRADADPAVALAEAEIADRFPGALTPRWLADRMAAAGPHPAHPVGPGAPAYVQYTSGTTGNPKGVLHRHADPEVYVAAMGRGAVEITPDDLLFSVSKAYFAYGFGNSVCFPLALGAAAVLHPDRPSVPAIVEVARRHRPSVLFTVPTFYARLVGQGGRETFGSLRVAVSAGETLLPALAERARDWLGCPVLDGLGSTEVGQTFVSNTLRARRDGTIGRVLPPYEIEVRDGVLYVRGPSVMLGYLNKPAETAAVLGDDGWLCTNDRASVDADGFVRHQGRADDMEMVGGITIAPQEVEGLLARHPAVAEVAVAAVREPTGESVLCAYVVTTAGHPGSAELGEELRAYVHDRLAGYKVPRGVTFLDALPRTPTGKLRRFLLREGGLRAPSAGPGG